MAAPIIVGFALKFIGFGYRGVAAGSTAAAIHAIIGAVRAGSLFAVSQSIGATGILFSPAYIATGGAAGLANGIIQKEKEKKDWRICFRKILPKL